MIFQVDHYLWNHPDTTIAGAIEMSANVKSGPAYAPSGEALAEVARDVEASGVKRLVIGISMGAVFLLLRLIRHGQVSRAASLIYLMPPMVAIEAAILFGEPLTLPVVLGTVIVVAGVYLVNRKTR